MKKKSISTTSLTEGKIDQIDQETTSLQTEITDTTQSRVLTTIADSQEEKEKLELKPVYIIYRDNDLYTGIVPDIIKEIQELGHRVKVQCFPKGTQGDIIEAYFERPEVLAELSDYTILADHTSEYEMPDYGKMFDLKDLDGVTGSVMSQIVGRDTKDIVMDTYRFKRFYKDLLEYKKLFQIILTGEEKPSKVYISKKYLDSHAFWIHIPRDIAKLKEMLSDSSGLEDTKTFLELLYGSEYTMRAMKEEFEQYRFVFDAIHTALHITWDDLQLDKDRLFDLFERGLSKDKLQSEAGYCEKYMEISYDLQIERIKDILQETGIERSTIEVVAQAADIPQDSAQERIIADRHDSTAEYYKRAKVIDLPLESMIYKMVAKGTFKIEKSVIEKTLSEKIQKLFKKQEAGEEK